MIFKLVLTRRALDDIRAAAQWWADNHSAVEAARWFDGIFEAMDALEHDASRHGLSRARVARSITNCGKSRSASVVG